MPPSPRSRPKERRVLAKTFSVLDSANYLPFLCIPPSPAGCAQEHRAARADMTVPATCSPCFGCPLVSSLVRLPGMTSWGGSARKRTTFCTRRCQFFRGWLCPHPRARALLCAWDCLRRNNRPAFPHRTRTAMGPKKRGNCAPRRFDIWVAFAVFRFCPLWGVFFDGGLQVRIPQRRPG